MVLHAQTATKLLRLIALVLCVATILSQSAVAHADSYNVSASVPYPAPAQAATFDQPLNNTTVSEAQQTITGGCELLSPEGTVSIWRDGVSIGSSICNGSFSIPIMLERGANILVARSASASGLYGPDSTSLTITLNIPVSVSQATPTNTAIASGLAAIPAGTFGTLDDANTVTVSITIAGGTPPYALTLNWGDGSVETHSISSADIYQFSHTYQTAATYIIRGETKDAAGATTQFSYAVVTTQQPTVGTGTPTHGSGRIYNSPNIIIPAILITAIFLVLVGDYWLGWRLASRHVKRIMAKKRLKKKPKRVTRR